MKQDIEKYLGSVSQATAKQIAEKIGLPQHDVALELNHMTRDDVVEREKRKGGGNEYVYWLSRGEAKAVVPSTTVHAPQPSATAIAPVGAAQAAPESAATTLSEQVRQLLDTLGLPPYMTQALSVARDMVEMAKATASERDQLRTRCEELAIERDSLQSANVKLKANNAELERKIDDLTLVDAEFKPNQVFVTIGRYAKPRRHKTLDKAQRRASALVRAEKESEVLVLEPVGRVVRGSEWRPI
ncbi:1-pyrroline-5-carboxylate dehydrogenase [Paraburkholderia caribensis]|uniref:1-pyrroline-5-carboxylate dehydrogenase n=1 Tax=Paraburkholderia caribensis TaxID=75105 RepID=UPI00285CE97E|nr:1-pyrroline-5-carboxylate dehydrogenase [Paraburkholderia caribensis]MDR6381783.1 hypothetical protein [Paraburkholderia caribensis]